MQQLDNSLKTVQESIYKYINEKYGIKYLQCLILRNGFGLQVQGTLSLYNAYALLDFRSRNFLVTKIEEKRADMKNKINKIMSLIMQDNIYHRN